MKKYAVAIFGPTGVGKTALALDLAKDKGEIISVDSMQVYKYMDIGTAKPSEDERNTIKHYLINNISPDRQFTAGDFTRSALSIINDILSHNKIPFLVGGTGLYFSSLMRGMVDIPKLDKNIKKKIIQKSGKIGQERMYKLLTKIDKDFANKIHPNDKQRTMRAIEVFCGTGKKFSDFQKGRNKKNDINYIKVGINIDRKKLYDIINQRVDKMIESGLIDEVENLKKKGYTKVDPGMKAIGYKELLEYLDGNMGKDEAVSLIKRNSRRYAKRQLTWFRNVDGVKWFDNNEKNEIKQYVRKKIGDI